MGVVLLGFEPGRLAEEHIQRVKEIASGRRVVVTDDREEIVGLLDEIEIAAGGFPRDLLSEASNLKWLQQWGAGADWLLRHEDAANLDFLLTNASGVHASPISEHILALLFAFARDLHHAIRRQERREWKRSELRQTVFEMNDKTMLLLGVGAIGERTAKLAKSIGMDVLGVRRHPEDGSPHVDEMHGPDELLTLLPKADFCVLTIPLTPETKGIIGEAELRAMKPTAHIVNIGRGGTIQEDILVQALREGWIAGAGLDVFETEPLPEDSPLWTLDNVIITAHYSGLTPHYNERAMDIFLENLARYQAGESLLNVVDKELGY